MKIDFKDIEFVGTIEDINDPLKEGRCKIRVHGIHNNNIPTESLPWAYPRLNNYFGKNGKNGSISIPKLKSVVVVTFHNGDLNSPLYGNIIEIADDIKEELNKEGEYEGSHFLLFDGDEDLKIWFTRNKGITIKLKGSRLNIGMDKTITIEHDESQSIIELSGPDIKIVSDSKINVTSQSEITLNSNDIWINGNNTRIGPNEVRGNGVLGDKLHLVLTSLASIIDSKYPMTPGATTQILNQLKETYLSKSVTISS